MRDERVTAKLHQVVATGTCFPTWGRILFPNQPIRQWGSLTAKGEEMENKKIVLSVVQSSNFCAASVIVQVQQ